MAMISVERDGPRIVPVPGRVVGVDPGLNVTGYAVVEPSPRGPYVLEAGVIRPHGRARHWASASTRFTRASSKCSSSTCPAHSPSSSSTATCSTPGPPF